MIKYIPLNQNILHEALNELDSGKCLLLFPTRKSKQEAQKLYQPDWDFYEHKFLTMDEWKEEIFHSKLPILKEEKRTLMFYRALSKENKDFFRIKTYFQSIELANNFFSFWEEIAEEMISEDDIDEVLFSKNTANDWQHNTFQQLLQIKEQYFKLLRKEQFSDTIFLHEINDIQFELNFDKIVVVNQFYFTELEKNILHKFDEKVVIYLQIPPKFYNEEDLTFKENFDAGVLQSVLKQKVRVITSSEQFQMIGDLLSTIDLQQKNTIIDFKFNSRSYAGFLSREYYSISNNLPFSGTSLFRFFQTLQDLLHSIVWEGTPFLLSLQELLNAALSDDFLEVFENDKNKHEQIRTFLFKCIDNDIQYLDLDYFTKHEEKFRDVFKKIFNLIVEVRKIDSITALINFIENHINIEKLTENKNAKTDILKVFYELLSDFASIEQIELIANWNQIFPRNISVNLWQLFLDYMKPKQIKYSLKNQFDNRVQVTSLQDTRNLHFENVYVLNAIEGILPATKHIQFLFSENQRKKLSLKTYEDIKLRDKYYFYRLLATSHNVTVFTRTNLEENIEVSSFIEELKLFDLIDEVELPEADLYQQIFTAILKDNGHPLPNQNEISADFFSIPFDKADLNNNEFPLSFYKWEKLKKDPFAFYLEFITDLKKRDPLLSQDFSNKLIGTISHSVFTKIWERLIEVYHGNKMHHNFVFNTKQYVDQAIEHFIKYKMKYISPHNYSENYFRNIFIPILKDGIANFFYRLHNDLKFTDEHITVFPETGKTEQKKFFKLDDIEISLRGRADLRIHSAKDIPHIFDYKTGSMNAGKIKRYNEQLQFYEFISYLIDSPEIEQKIQSHLFFVEQKIMTELTKRIDLKDTIQEVLQNIIESGFALADKKDTYEDIEITRRDLKMKTETQ
ncbi:MAG: PD-(D/E)XK nuclease family protein [Candidatus Cloacimonadota bacterium]|nr:PD-(D/E)XK nuclease family protein [Candidatus Cloacimonadota bacterium]